MESLDISSANASDDVTTSKSNDLVQNDCLDLPNEDVVQNKVNELSNGNSEELYDVKADSSSEPHADADSIPIEETNLQNPHVNLKNQNNDKTSEIPEQNDSQIDEITSSETGTTVVVKNLVEEAQDNFIESQNINEENATCINDTADSSGITENAISYSEIESSTIEEGTNKNSENVHETQSNCPSVTDSTSTDERLNILQNDVPSQNLESNEFEVSEDNVTRKITIVDKIISDDALSIESSLSIQEEIIGEEITNKIGENTNVLSESHNSVVNTETDDYENVYSTWVSTEDQMVNPNIDGEDSGKVILPMSSDMIHDAYEENVHITDLTCPPTVTLGNISIEDESFSEPQVCESFSEPQVCESFSELQVCEQPHQESSNETGDHSNVIETPTKDNSSHIIENNASEADHFPILNSEIESRETKPSIIKILPIKNGHGLWNIEELRLMLEDKGSILLKLCLSSNNSTDETDGEPDFSAILLDTDYKITPPHFNGIENLHGTQSNLIENASPTHNKNTNMEHLIKRDASENFSPLYADSQKISNHYSSGFPQRNILSPRSGRRRGRPPLWCRPNHLPKPLFPPRPLNYDEPVKFKPPTSTYSYVAKTDNAKESSSENSKKHLSDPALKSHILARKAAKIIEQEELKKKLIQTEKLLNEVERIEKVEIGKVVPKIPSSGGIHKIFIKLPCPHCDLTFRKRLSLAAHIKHKHKLMKTCPICKESVKMIRKNSLKTHMVRAHQDEFKFQCDMCEDSFKLPQYLAYHKKFSHKIDISEEESEESEDEVGKDKPAATKRKINGDCAKTTKRTKVNESESEDSDDSDSKSSDTMVTRRSLRSSAVNDNEQTAKSPTKSNMKNKSIDNKRSEALKKAPAKRTVSPKHPKGRTNRALKNDEHSVTDGGRSSDESEITSDDDGGKFTCNLCSFSCDLAFKLRAHKRKAHSGSEKTSNVSKSNSKSTCDKCNKKFASMSLLEDHMEEHNSQKVSSARKTRSSQSGTLDSIKGKKMTLEESFRALSEASKNSTLTSKTRDQSDEDEESSDEDEESNDESETKTITKNSSSWPPYVSRKGKFFHCGKCKVTFKRDKQMTYHLKKIHETLYPFRKCPNCPRIFRSCGPFVRHLREHKAHQCPVNGCKIKYKILRLVKRHQRSSHADYPHRCQKCVQLFKRQNDLKKHMAAEHVAKEEQKDTSTNDDSEDESEVETKPDKKTLNRSSPTNKKRNSPKRNKIPPKVHSDAASSEEESESETSSADKSDNESVVAKKAFRKSPAIAVNDKSKNVKTNVIKDNKNKVIGSHSQNKAPLSNKESFKSNQSKQTTKSSQNSDEGRSKRNTNLVSYKENDSGEEEVNINDLIPVKRRGTANLNNLPKIPQEINSSSDSTLINLPKKPQETHSSSNSTSTTTDNFKSTSNTTNQPINKYEPVNNFKDILKGSSPSSSQTAANDIKAPNNSSPPEICARQKRRYVRKAPYKRKVDNSWTAALKARHYGVSPEAVLKEYSVYRPPQTPRASLSPPLDVATPVENTANVVRRVAESLISKQQVQSQQPAKKAPRRRGKLPNAAAFDRSVISYSPRTSYLPRVTFPAMVGNSRDTSLSSFEDASLLDNYAVPHAAPADDDEDSKELGFDSF